MCIYPLYIPPINITLYNKISGTSGPGGVKLRKLLQNWWTIEGSF